MKNYIYIITIHLFFLQVNLNAQMIPCVGGVAGPFSCNNYDLMSNISNITLAGIGGTSTNDLWGWTDPSTGKEYALVGTHNGTAFVDISDPINPILLGRLPTHDGIVSAWRDMKVYNNFVFIVVDSVRDHGMQVFDLTRLRGVTSVQTFNADARYAAIGRCHNIVINESEAVAYLVGCNAYAGGPAFVDISDPLNPVGIGGYSDKGYSHDAQVITYNGPDLDYVGKEIYIGSNGNSDRVVLLDVTDKKNVIEISEITYPQIGYSHQGWFTEDQRYFLLGDELDEIGFGFNTRTVVLDFSDLDNPVIASSYFGATEATDHNGYVKGNKYYLANYRAGLRVLDITNIASPNNPITEIGHFDTFPIDDGPNFNGAWSVYPYFASGNIIISDIEGGLFIVRQSNTLSTPPVLNLNNNSFTLYPNPTNDGIVTISKSGNHNIESVEVYNVLGQKIYQKHDLNKDKIILSVLKKHNKGIYLVKINNTVTKKLILK